VLRGDVFDRNLRFDFIADQHAGSDKSRRDCGGNSARRSVRIHQFLLAFDPAQSRADV
jgi:hypothetical protein